MLYYCSSQVLVLGMSLRDIMLLGRVLGFGFIGSDPYSNLSVNIGGW